MGWQGAVSRLGAAAMLVSILCGVVGCAVDEPPLETSDDAQTATSKERTLLFADDDASRVACRDVTNRYFCSEEDARSAARACATSASGAPTSLSSSRSPVACSKSGELYPTVGSCETPLPRHCGFYSACLERTLPAASTSSVSPHFGTNAVSSASVVVGDFVPPHAM